ncbi:flagellar hook-length control protein FliK [Thauera sp.]|uniref:flagellar hook-length control protein FliK n=1 Tax=Thauera sp. TaxID=1905334 RepID=UPI001B7746CF|nr:flagellar hook-length control protein FliK [Thauera sp.]MBP6130303.1 flagellar hook-length control protein FliK [Thauera sp.]MBP7047526.1 flagellar hook-length control protein FliK [Thauera sp.]
MIPSDLAARLRTLTEASFFETEPPVPGLQRAREIQSRLPELVPGQRFFATLQRTLPDGSFRAVVAGQQMTLALDGSAKAGDTLELEVTQLTPRTVFARVVGGEAATTAGASAQPALSQTGRLISFLLTGQPVPSPASLAGNRPLLDAPPTAGSQLVPVLRQALGQSGLFYESHQVQWVLGKLDTAALLREPQGQAGGANTAGGGAGASAGGAAAAAAGGAAASGPGATAAAAAGPATATAGQAAGTTAETASRATEATASRSAADTEAKRSASTSARAALDETAAPRPGAIPERLMPVVHQQLDALATQQYVWQGQAWPGQNFEWWIEDPQREGEHAGDEPENAWNTTLRLTLPRLGGVEARLHLTPAGVALRLVADDRATLQTLDGGAAALASALEAANLKLTGLVIEPRAVAPNREVASDA